MRTEFLRPAIKTSIGLLSLFAFTGCTDGLMHKMKSANPYFINEWKKDSKYGVTYIERVDELKRLQQWLPNMEPSEQATWAERLEERIKKDASPEFRCLAVQTITAIDCPTTVRALNSASTDQAEKVRLAACEAWPKVGGKEARDMLLTLATNAKETPSVRRAAVASLAKFDDAEVRSTLANILDDKSPALQYQATVSLKQITGKDFGGDLQSWRDFMQGKDVPEPEKGFMANVWETLSWSR